MGLKKLPAEPAEGRSTQVWADSARNLVLWRLGAGELAGLRWFTARRIGPVSGLTLMLALACRHSAQRHRRRQGTRSPQR